ncbi:bcl-2-like protein 15 isoform X2 [Anolis carolinensis]|uniref:bcl-2-like protein 15 isoform X2 n=1 Tax=Anolis carolinensis TaxID=28377 RepID=UPI002F2B4E29
MKLTFEEQTKLIVEELLCDNSGATFRSLHASASRSDTDSSASSFDPKAIASTLRELGDKFNVEVESQAQAIVGQSNMLEKFKEIADSLSRKAALEYGKAFLAVSVKLFLCLAQSTEVEPHLLAQAINDNHAVRDYIENKGGWENLAKKEGQNNH